jgi:hypothetical protein
VKPSAVQVSVATSTSALGTPLRRAAVGEHESTLGVGVDHLDRRAVERVQDVARPAGRAAGRLLEGPDRQTSRTASPSSAIALSAASTEAPGAMSCFSAVGDCFGFSHSRPCRGDALATAATSGPAASGGS